MMATAVRDMLEWEGNRRAAGVLTPREYLMKTSDNLIVLLRFSLGWLFAYAGLTKILDPAWSSAGYLTGAKTFGTFYQWLASPGILPAMNVINEWALLLLGVSLIFGIFVRLSSILGAVLMALYYFPVLDFPYVGKNYFLIDEHVVFAVALLLLADARAGRVWGLENWCSGLPICSRFPKLRKLFG